MRKKMRKLRQDSFKLDCFFQRKGQGIDFLRISTARKIFQEKLLGSHGREFAVLSGLIFDSPTYS